MEIEKKILRALNSWGCLYKPQFEKLLYFVNEKPWTPMLIGITDEPMTSLLLHLDIFKVDPLSGCV